jgi:ketosteroid isomerase-like protein
MVKRVMICLATILMCARSAMADPAAVVKAHSDAFAKAFNSCDIPAALELYEDNAVLIWPGEREVANGKAAIAKVIKVECSSAAKSSLKQVSSDSNAIGKDYIINVGMWDDTMPGPDGKPMTARVRTTELLHRSNGKWRYVIDHASIGLPPPPAKQ